MTEIKDLVNLTPHRINLVSSGTTIEIPSRGVVRLNVIRKQVGNIEGIPIYEMKYGDPIIPEGLDLKDKSVIVSSIVAIQKWKYLIDLGVKHIYVPDTSDAIRDENGNIIGTRGLIQHI